MSREFCRLLKRGIDDEFKAFYIEYATLVDEAPAEVKKSIASIKNQEGRHHKTLQKIERKYCGGK